MYTALVAILCVFPINPKRTFNSRCKVFAYYLFLFRMKCTETDNISFILKEALRSSKWKHVWDCRSMNVCEERITTQMHTFKSTWKKGEHFPTRKHKSFAEQNSSFLFFIGCCFAYFLVFCFFALSLHATVYHFPFILHLYLLDSTEWGAALCDAFSLYSFDSIELFHPTKECEFILNIPQFIRSGLLSARKTFAFYLKSSIPFSIHLCFIIWTFFKEMENNYDLHGISSSNNLLHDSKNKTIDMVKIMCSKWWNSCIPITSTFFFSSKPKWKLNEIAMVDGCFEKEQQLIEMMIQCVH